MTINPMAIPGIYSETIEDIAARIWEIEKSLLKSKTRKTEVVVARQVLMNYRNKNKGQSLAKSAGIYKKDHATCSHANKKVDDYLFSDRVFKEKYEEFHRKVKELQ